MQALQHLRRDLPQGQPRPDPRRHHRGHRLHPLRPVRALLPGPRDRGPAQARRERPAAAGELEAEAAASARADGGAAHPRRRPRPGRRRHRSTSRHHRHGERSGRRPRQPDLIGRDIPMTKRLVQGNEAVLLGRGQGRRDLLRRLSDQPLVRDPGPGLGLRGAATPSSASSRQRTRSPAPTRSSAAAWPARSRSPRRPGPGFSLMQEAIGYGHKVGIPCVIVNVMRVGPGNRHADDARPGRPQPGALRLHGRLHQHRLLPVDRGRVLRVHDPRLQRGGGEPEPGHPAVRRVPRPPQRGRGPGRDRRPGRAADPRAAGLGRDAALLGRGHLPRRRAGHGRRRRVHPPVLRVARPAPQGGGDATRSTSTAGTRRPRRS